MNKYSYGDFEVLIDQKDEIYSVYISSFRFCGACCSYCSQESNEIKNHSKIDILRHTIDAIWEEQAKEIFMSQKSIRICWYGEMIVDLFTIEFVSIELAKYVIENDLANGLDSICFHTTLPISFDKNLEPLQYIDNFIRDINLPLNPKKDYDKESAIKIYYSFHTHENLKRREFIPTSGYLYNDIDVLKIIYSAVGIKTVFCVLIQDQIDLDEIRNLFEFYMRHLSDFDMNIFCNTDTKQEFQKIFGDTANFLEIENFSDKKCLNFLC